MRSMNRTSLGQVAWQFALGSTVVAAVTVAGYQLGADSATAALLYFCVVVLTSLGAGRPASLLVSVVAMLCLDYFFTPALFSIGLIEPIDGVALLALSLTGLVITHLIITGHDDIPTTVRAMKAPWNSSRSPSSRDRSSDRLKIRRRVFV